MVLKLVIVGGSLLMLCAVAVFAIFARATRSDSYPEAAAEAPKRFDQHAEQAIVVAGSDLDRARRPIADVNEDLLLMVAEDEQLSSLCGLAAELEPFYVVPEVQR